MGFGQDQSNFLAFYVFELTPSHVLFGATGQVLSYDNIQEIIQFAKEEGLFIMADEVCTLSIIKKLTTIGMV